MMGRGEKRMTGFASLEARLNKKRYKASVVAKRKERVVLRYGYALRMSVGCDGESMAWLGAGSTCWFIGVTFSCIVAGQD